MTIKQVSREKTNMRLAIAGQEGAGKTVSALLTAFGLCGDWSKIALIDTEQGSAAYHSYLGKFNTVTLYPPYTPERFMQAVNLCEKEGMEVIIVDEASKEWSGEGGVLEIYQAYPGQPTDKWKEAMSYHYEFLATLLALDTHLIATIKSTQYCVGQQQNFMDSFTTVFRLQEGCRATAQRDRTLLYAGSEPVVLTPEVGEQLRRWCHQEGGEKFLQLYDHPLNVA